MGLEASRIEAKQGALDITVTDLVRIVGDLEKKMDAGFHRLASDIASVKVDTMTTKQQLDQVQQQLAVILSRLPG